ncbi:hypothetical protein GF373_06135 [bacterium]|nr:hypothetical protein [bacterium]
MNTKSNQPTHTASPCPITGSLISSHPILTSLVAFLVFWLFHSKFYSGDGDQIARFIEAGTWMVQSELLSHAIFQAVYQILHPFGWDGMSVINLVSCLAGAVSIYFLLKFNNDYIKIDPIWPLALFASSALLVFACGHTEYYTLFIAALFFYIYIAVGYLHQRFTIIHTGLAFSLAAWMHLGTLFALPSLLLLPYLRKEYKDYQSLFFLALLPLYFTYFLKTNYYLFGFNIVGQSKAANFVPFKLPTDEIKYYTMFDWGHLLDILWAWSMRSWIFWPLLIYAACLAGWKAFLRHDRAFLLLCTLCFTGFALVWHPDLRVTQDWDLFAFELVPQLLLLLTFIPYFLKNSFNQSLLTILTYASILITFSYVLNEAEFGGRGYGQVKIQLEGDIACDNLTLNGHKKDLEIPGIQEGVYNTKLIDKTNRKSHNFYLVVSPNKTTVAAISN